MSDYEGALQAFNIARKSMLRSNTIQAVDEIIFAKPIVRCIILAQAIQKAAEPSPKLQKIVIDSGVMRSLQEEAQRRKSAPSFSPVSLIAPDPKGLGRQKDR